ncbi:hypothetical protein JCM17961_08940 [Endothiovibrio diazotrophicus]
MDNDPLISPLVERLTREIDEEQSVRSARDTISKIIGEYGARPRSVFPQVLAELEHHPSLEFLHAVARNYWRTFHAGRARRYPAHEKLKRLAPDAFAGIVSTMNNQRGRLYERTFGEAMVRSELERRHPGKRFTIEVDRRSFTTVIDERPTKRRADLYIEELGMMIEIKSGRVHHNRHVRRQIRKDAQLLRDGVVDECHWFLFYGASKRVLDDLDRSGIDFYDFEFGFDDDEPDDDTAMIIRV